MGDALIGRGEAQEAFPGLGHGETGSGQIRFAMGNAVQQFRQAFLLNEVNLHAQMVGKGLDQLVFGTGGPMRTNIIGGRTITGENPQFPTGQHFLQRVALRRTGVEHQRHEGANDNQAGENDFPHTRPTMDFENISTGSHFSEPPNGSDRTSREAMRGEHVNAITLYYNLLIYGRHSQIGVNH